MTGGEVAKQVAHVEHKCRCKVDVANRTAHVEHKCRCKVDVANGTAHVEHRCHSIDVAKETADARVT